MLNSIFPIKTNLKTKLFIFKMIYYAKNTNEHPLLLLLKYLFYLSICQFFLPLFWQKLGQKNFFDDRLFEAPWLQRLNNVTQVKIFDQTGVAQSTVSKTIAKYKEIGLVNHLKGNGRPKRLNN
jgi:Fic family protein